MLEQQCGQLRIVQHACGAEQCRHRPVLVGEVRIRIGPALEQLASEADARETRVADVLKRRPTTRTAALVRFCRPSRVRARAAPSDPAQAPVVRQESPRPCPDDSRLRASQSARRSPLVRAPAPASSGSRARARAPTARSPNEPAMSPIAPTPQHRQLVLHARAPWPACEAARGSQRPPSDGPVSATGGEEDQWQASQSNEGGHGPSRGPDAFFNATSTLAPDRYVASAQHHNQVTLRRR
jgi:hypothetical protein